MLSRGMLYNALSPAEMTRKDWNTVVIMLSNSKLFLHNCFILFLFITRLIRTYQYKSEIYVSEQTALAKSVEVLSET